MKDTRTRLSGCAKTYIIIIKKIQHTLPQPYATTAPRGSPHLHCFDLVITLRTGNQVSGPAPTMSSFPVHPSRVWANEI